MLNIFFYLFFIATILFFSIRSFPLQELTQECSCGRIVFLECRNFSSSQFHHSRECILGRCYSKWNLYSNKLFITIDSDYYSSKFKFKHIYIIFTDLHVYIYILTIRSTLFLNLFIVNSKWINKSKYSEFNH